MRDQAQQRIKSCHSLEALQRIWAKNSQKWKSLPMDQAAAIIQLKDRRKEEIKNGIYRRRMDSKILGVVDVVFDTHKPDQAMVGGVPYSNQELTDLISRGISAADLITVHEVIRSFEGHVIPDAQKN